MIKNKIICGIFVDSDGVIVIQTGEEKKFLDSVDQFVKKLKSYCSINNEEEIALNDVCLGIERFLAWKKYYQKGMPIPQKILQELVPALEYVYEKEEKL